MTRISPREAEKRILDLAKGPTSTSKEKELVETLQQLTPEDRGEALRLLDGRNSRHGVDHLIVDDIDNPLLKNEALRLIGEARPFMASPGRVIVSDIDDTVKPNKDPSFKGEVYPGARAFYAALDVGKDGSDVVGDIHFVTARDGVAKRAGHTLQETGIEVGSISYGNSIALLLAQFGVHKGIENAKVKDILNLIEKNPSRQVVLLGDNVQADPAVFRRVLAQKPEAVELVLIHAVPGFQTPADMAAHPKVVVYTNYLDAADQLLQRGLLTQAQRDAVAADFNAAR
jgi:hypothetical protein